MHIDTMSGRLVRTLGLTLALFAGACTPEAAQPPAQPTSAASDSQVAEPTQSMVELTGHIEIDGSSTVFPITEAVAEEFQNLHRSTRVTVGISGTGGGFKRFCSGETVIQDASRPIKPSEMEQCEQAGVTYIELPVAYDGLAVMVHPDNDWVECLTVAQLDRMWAPESEGTVMRWSDVDPAFPDVPLELYGPGVDSGTYDYFTGVVTGEEGSSRGDFTPSEDDNVLVQGIAGDPNSLGFFGYAYYLNNADKLKIVPIDGGNGCVVPSDETVADGSYAPLSRPIFIYVAEAATIRPEVDAFVSFFLDNAAVLVQEVGYTGLPAVISDLAADRYARRVTGTVFETEASQATPLETLLRDSN